MKLTEYYKLKPKAIYPKTELIDEILNECIREFGEGDVCRGTVLNWVTGVTRPSDDKYLPVISKVTGIPQHQLF
jgi:hypothetical protein